MNSTQSANISWDEESEEYTDPELSLYEKVVLTIMAFIISSFLLISGWNGMLIFLGIEQGGGPLGMISRFLCIHALTS